MKRLGLTALLVIVLSELGCSQFHEYADERLTASRNRHLAKQAWQRVEAFHCQQSCLDDFGDGYQAGYFDALGGGNGCPPALPPKRYWRVCFQNPIGHLRIESWFEGFRQGSNGRQTGRGRQLDWDSHLDPQTPRTGRATGPRGIAATDSGASVITAPRVSESHATAPDAGASQGGRANPLA